MPAFFVYNNLKVSPFILGDAPLPGFSLLTWDNESSVMGTLWDIGPDAGLTHIGNKPVFGQLWLADDVRRISELEEYMGVISGLTHIQEVEVLIKTSDGEIENIVKALTFYLTLIKKEYTIVSDGKWLIKRQRESQLI